MKLRSSMGLLLSLLLFAGFETAEAAGSKRPELLPDSNITLFNQSVNNLTEITSSSQMNPEDQSRFSRALDGLKQIQSLVASRWVRFEGTYSASCEDLKSAIDRIAIYFGTVVQELTCNSGSISGTFSIALRDNPKSFALPEDGKGYPASIASEVTRLANELSQKVTQGRSNQIFGYYKLIGYKIYQVQSSGL